MFITNHAFEPQSLRPGCGHSLPSGTYCDRPRDDHAFGPLLPSGPPVRSDYERALERIRELEEVATALRTQRSVLIDSERSLNIKLATATKRAETLESELYYSEEERLKAKEEAGNTRLVLEESMRNEAALRTRLSNLDVLAREITERVTKMVGALDK